MARVFGNSCNEPKKMPIFDFITQPPHFKQIHHNHMHCKILKIKFSRFFCLGGVNYHHIQLSFFLGLTTIFFSFGFKSFRRFSQNLLPINAKSFSLRSLMVSPKKIA